MYLDDELNKTEEKVLAGNDLRTPTPVGKSLEFDSLISTMTANAVNELVLERLSRPSSAVSKLIIQGLLADFFKCANCCQIFVTFLDEMCAYDKVYRINLHTNFC